MLSHYPPPKTSAEIRSRITQIHAQRKSALTTQHNFKSSNDPALAEYCLRLHLRLHELHWALGEKPKYDA